MFGLGARFTSRGITAAVVAVGLAVAVGCAAITENDEHRMPVSAASAAAQLPAPSDGVERLSDKELIPVYWMQASNDGVYLYREYARTESSGDPVTAALTYLLNEMPGKEGWFTYLKPASDIGVSISVDNVITLDLPQRVFSAKLDEGLALRTIQQLVFTSTAAASNAGLLNDGTAPRVKILVDGVSNATVFKDFGLAGEYQRDTSVVAPIWIIDPQNGAQASSGKVVLNARSISFTDGIYFQIEKATDSLDWAPVDQPSEIALTELAEDGSFSRELELSPGEYRVTLWGQNAGSESKIARVTSMFNVR